MQRLCRKFAAGFVFTAGYVEGSGAAFLIFGRDRPKVFRRSKGVTLSLRQDSSEFSSALAVGIARAQASRESAVTTRVPAGSFIAFLAILRKGNLANHLYNTNTRC